MNLSAQVNSNVKVMAWNVLNWPSISNTVADTTLRGPAYRKVMRFYEPDIVVTSENTSTNSIPWFLDQVMNTGTLHYEAGTFINGPDTDNGIFYRDSLFDFVSNQPVQTALRDISHFTLVFKATGDTLHIFSLHLKASLGYEAERAAEVDRLRQVTNAFPPGTNFLIAGDFNIYETGELAYFKLLYDTPGDDGHVLDPIQLSGIWNNSAYAPHHTQSTRMNGMGGGSGGGMNDRFDMILYSNGVKDPTGVYYLQGSYGNIGNDGNHYDREINNGTNTAVPADVADALFDASDHLPVYMTLSIGPTAGIDDIYSAMPSVDIFPNPIEDNSRIKLSLQKRANIEVYITDAIGRTMHSEPSRNYFPGDYLLETSFNIKLPAGFYFLSVKIDNHLISKKIISIR